ncbi:MAG TPA: hypothetical protein VFP11_16615 [Candidatus Angelobacter sp.]|nr:hypothetical protein [Candidatus Angelobacter sp.]
MNFWRLIIAFSLCVAAHSFAQNAELKKLAQQDQAVRMLPPEEAGKVGLNDDDRVQLVLEFLAKGTVQTPEDKFYAALILDHTPLASCEGRVVAKSPYNFLLSYYLARQSFEAGYKSAGILVAQAMDRYLSFTVGHQKYGTNRVYNQTTGKEELVPIDRTVSDSERAKYGVQPLAELLKQWPEQKTEKKPAAQKSH